MTLEKPLDPPSPKHSRIVDISLNVSGGLPRSPEIAMEHHRAISDLLAENSFGPLPDMTGPYRLTLGLAEERLLMDVECITTGTKETLRISLKSLKPHIESYALLVDSFYKTAKEGQLHKLELMDAGRRGLHDEGAEILTETLENKVILDKPTARRLFSLVYVLHIRTLTETF